MKVTPEKITNIKPNEIFVFGSNLLGLHYGGAAYFALKLGAEMHNGVGLQGNTYAIPTMGVPGDRKTKLPIPKLAKYVNQFISFAKQNKDLFFLVTPIGCGIAGFQIDEIAPLFKGALKLKNVSLPKSFLEYFGIYKDIEDGEEDDRDEDLPIDNIVDNAINECIKNKKTLD